MRAAILAAIAILAAAPAHASSLGITDVARIYCDAVIGGEMAPVLDLLTADLREAVDDSTDAPLLWQERAEPAKTCMPVGNRGTRERPETIVSFGVPGKPGFSETIVMVFVDDELRIDDVVFSDGTTLRERLAAPA